MKNILLLILAFNFSVFAADLHLFDSEGKFNVEFAKQILESDLKVGENIYLRDRALKYRGVLGSGNTTLILDVLDPETNNEMALRLPYGNVDMNYDIASGQRYINFFLKGYKELKDALVPVPKIHDYLPKFYILLDKVPHDFNLRTFLSRHENYESSEKKLIQEALYEFAKQVSMFERIGDFHLEQIVYSKETNQWTLLDWAHIHELARQPSVPNIFKKDLFLLNTIELDEDGKPVFEVAANGEAVPKKRIITNYEMRIANKLEALIKDERTLIIERDKSEAQIIKARLTQLNDLNDILEVYKELNMNHMANFFADLQKDFIDNHLPKFPVGSIGITELKPLLSKLGKFTPFYFSQFAEKVITNINDLQTFNFLYQKINAHGVDEELEDDIARAIGQNIERILSNSFNSPENIKIAQKLSSDFGLINYSSRQILADAQSHFKSSQTCQESLNSFLQATSR